MFEKISTKASHGAQLARRSAILVKIGFASLSLAMTACSSTSVQIEVTTGAGSAEPLPTNAKVILAGPGAIEFTQDALTVDAALRAACELLGADEAEEARGQLRESRTPGDIPSGMSESVVGLVVRADGGGSLSDQSESVLAKVKKAARSAGGSLAVVQSVSYAGSATNARVTEVSIEVHKVNCEAVESATEQPTESEAG